MPPADAPPPCALVVHESMFGNTAAIAAAVSRGLQDAGLEVTAGEVGTVDPLTVRHYDLVVVGAPTHAFSLSRPATRADAQRQGALSVGQTGLREWIVGLPLLRRERAPLVAAFDTRVTKVARLPKSAATRATTLLRRKGYHLLAPPQGFLVEDLAGPLVPGEEARAQEWSAQLATGLRSAGSPV